MAIRCIAGYQPAALFLKCLIGLMSRIFTCAGTIKIRDSRIHSISYAIFRMQNLFSILNSYIVLSILHPAVCGS